ncbi:amidohydrolase family protein [bacterium]|nr:amidohydrolase family protein [bacterium]
MNILLQGCNIIDVNTGEYIQNGEILIRKDSIDAVGKAGESNIQNNTRTIDLRGCWVLPGLSDVHVHLCHEGSPELAKTFSPFESVEFAILRAAKNISIALNAGITLLRDVGTYKGRGIQIREATEKGIIIGPRIMSCGHILTSPKGHVHEIGREIKGINEIREAVVEEIEAGADFIKITNDPIGLSVDEIEACVEEAHRFGKKVACHAFTEESIAVALDANVDTIEHGVPFNIGMINQMKKQGTIIVPTFHCAIETCRDTKKSMIKKAELPVFKQWLEVLEQNLPIAINEGVRIATGTDAGYPPLEFDAVIEEIICLVNIGATPLQALQYATKFSAEACGLGNIYGEIQEGKKASLIVLPENPLNDINALYNVKIVIKDGILIYPNKH